MDKEWFERRRKELSVKHQDLADAISRDRTIVTKVLGGKIPFDVQYVDGFARVLKVSKAEILRQAGILDEGTASAPQVALLAVQLPNVALLTQMFAGFFQATGKPELADELAPQLALLLPSGLEQAQARGSTPAPQDDDPAPGAGAPLRATRRHGKPRRPNT